MWGAVLHGVASGVVYGLTGYAKAIKRGIREPFNPKKFIQSIIIGAIVGGYAGYAGIALPIAYQTLLDMGMIALIENLKKWIARSFLGIEL